MTRSAIGPVEKNVAPKIRAAHVAARTIRGKTEDDTFVHLDMLERRAAPPHVDERAKYYLWPLWHLLDADAHAPSAQRIASARAFLAPWSESAGSLAATGAIVLWRAGGGKGGGGGTMGGMKRKCQPGSAEPAPFPTGPLAVFSAGLAAAVFSSCTYLERFLARGRKANRETLCRGHDKQRSWANLVGDCAIGHWVSQCARGLNVTIAHMTYTKAHHYATDAGPGRDGCSRATSRLRCTGQEMAHRRRGQRAPRAESGRTSFAPLHAPAVRACRPCCGAISARSGAAKRPAAR